MHYYIILKKAVGLLQNAIYQTVTSIYVKCGAVPNGEQKLALFDIESSSYHD
jgi:hypothetical protein